MPIFPSGRIALVLRPRGVRKCFLGKREVVSLVVSLPMEGDGHYFDLEWFEEACHNYLEYGSLCQGWVVIRWMLEARSETCVGYRGRMAAFGS